MIKKIALALCALTLLAGCAGSSRSQYGDDHVAEFTQKVGDKVYFAFDSDMLSQETKQNLQQQIKWLQDYPKYSIVVEGYCDERGTAEYNLALGARRAEAVRMFLVKHGIEEGRINTVSYGKERPAVMGNDESAWKWNRRAVTVLK